MDKKYLWLLFLAAIVFLAMVVGINMFVKSAQNIQPVNAVKETVPVVTNTDTTEKHPEKERAQEEPVYEQQLPKGQVLLN